MGLKIIRHSKAGVATAIVPNTPVVAPGQLWQILYPDGTIFAAGFRGLTQDHPLPYSGGFYMDFGKLPQGIAGWDVATGDVPTQSAAGLRVVANAGNAVSLLDFPVFGDFVIDDMILFLTIICPTPGAANYAGLDGFSPHAGIAMGSAIHSDGVDWRVATRTITTISRATAGAAVALANLDTLTYCRAEVSTHASTFNLRVLTSSMGTKEVASLANLGVRSTNYTIGEDITVPTPVQARAFVNWGANDDMDVTLHGMAVRTPLVSAMVA